MRAYLLRADDEHGDFFERLSDAAVALTGDPCSAHIEDVTWPLPNVWLGVSTERQQEADERIPDLINTPAAIRFVSAEPLLGPIDFRKACSFPGRDRGERPLDWIIVGGESGPGAREFKLGWASDIVSQCQQADVAVFVKQIGARPTYCRDGIELPVAIRDRKGGDMSEWPEELCVRQMPRSPAPSAEEVS
jgi:protein gp37